MQNAEATMQENPNNQHEKSEIGVKSYNPARVNREKGYLDF
jgi:hypothetical protein